MSKIKEPKNWVLGGNPFPALLSAAFLVYPHRAERGEIERGNL